MTQPKVPARTFSPSAEHVTDLRQLLIDTLDECGWTLIRKQNAETSWHALDELLRTEIEHHRFREHMDTLALIDDFKPLPRGEGARACG